MSSKTYYMNIDEQYNEEQNYEAKNENNNKIKNKLRKCINTTINNVKYHIKKIDKEKGLNILKFSYFILFLYNFIFFINSNNMSFFYLFNIISSFIILLVMIIISKTFDVFIDNFMLGELKKTLIFLIIVLIFFSFLDIIIIYITQMKLNISKNSIIKASFSIIGQLLISLLYIYILFKNIISIKKQNINDSDNNSDNNITTDFNPNYNPSYNPVYTEYKSNNL